MLSDGNSWPPQTPATVRLVRGAPIMSPVVTRILLSLSLCGSLAATPAFAEPEAPSATIRTDDLDLATPAGERTLHHRVAWAVTTICSGLGVRDLATVSREQACRTAAMAKVAPQIEVAIANARTGKAYAVNDAKGGPTPPAS
jgi:UrcA family protein